MKQAFDTLCLNPEFKKRNADMEPRLAEPWDEAVKFFHRRGRPVRRRTHAAAAGRRPGCDADAGGAPLAIGGKTGTGDHRLVRFGRHGEILESQPRARTASFAFFLGDRYFGVLTASVSGPEAADYTFTSALPVELVRVLAPILERTIAASDVADLRAFL